MLLQISNYLNRLREQSLTEGESNNKLYARSLTRMESTGAPNAAASRGIADASPSGSPSASRDAASGKDAAVEALAGLSLDELLDLHNKTKRQFFERRTRPSFQLDLALPRLERRFNDPNQTLKLAPSSRAKEEDERHCQPIDVMSDYESRLIKKEALRNPLGEPEPDEDTPTGLRRRQLCFNLGNPYKKNTSKVNTSMLLNASHPLSS